MVGPTLQVGKLRQGFSEAPPGGSTGPEKWSYAAITIIVGTDPKWLEGPAAGRGLWRPRLVTAKAGSGSHGVMLLLSPSQVSWAAPSRLSDTAPTISKNSTTSEVPSRKVPCPLLPRCPHVPGHHAFVAATTSPWVYSQGGWGREGIPECHGCPGMWKGM